MNEEAMAQGTEPVVTDNSQQMVESNAVTEPIAESAPPQAILKINYLGEEKELSLDDAKTLAQKGMDYDRQRERWDATKPLVENFEKVARDYGWLDANGHGDTKSFLEAMSEAKRKEEIEAIQENTQLPKELAEELYVSRLERQQREAERKEFELKQNQEREGIEFLEYFKQINGRSFDTTDDIPAEVIQANKNGVPLKYAYAEHLSKKLISDKHIEEKNAENAETSTGSVNGQGAVIEKEFFTSEEIDRLTPKELDNPTIMAKVFKSLTKLG